MLEQLLTFYSSPAFIGSLSVLILILLLFLGLRNHNGSVYLFFEVIFEKALTFFEDIIGNEVHKNIVVYVVVLFFIILLSNMFGVLLEIIAPAIGMTASWDFILSKYIIIPSADINFNIALAALSICILLWVQMQGIGFRAFLYEYFPIFGKDYITMEVNKDTNKYLYAIQKAGVKVFDIILSLFLGLLDIVGLFAKIISLSFRLFGNMTSGTVLLGITVVGLSGMTQNWFGFEFPVGLPVIVYLQEILVWVIQAFVFAMLVAIFIQLAIPEKETVEQVA